jgi:hypothetical protein
MPIPARIISFWHDRSTVPDAIVEAQAQSRANAGVEEFLLADDDYLRQQLRLGYPSVIETLYDRIRVPAARADLARMVLLHQLGGIYLDATFVVRRPLMELIPDGVDHLFVQRDDNHAARRVPGRAALVNGLLAAVPGSPVIARCIDRILNNLVDGDFNRRLVHAMGAGVLTSIVDGTADQSGMRFVSLQTLREDYVDHIRVEGHSNKWVEQQAAGIIDPAYLRDNARSFERRWSLGRNLFHLRVSRLKL